MPLFSFITDINGYFEIPTPIPPFPRLLDTLQHHPKAKELGKLIRDLLSFLNNHREIQYTHLL